MLPVCRNELLIFATKFTRVNFEKTEETRINS